MEELNKVITLSIYSISDSIDSNRILNHSYENLVFTGEDEIWIV